MAKTTIASGDAESLCKFLDGVSEVADLPASLREACRYWAHRVHSRTQRQDLQQVVWLLRSTSEHRRMPADQRKEAHWWTARLERGW